MHRVRLAHLLLTALTSLLLALACASCDPVKLIPPLGLGKTYPPATLSATGPGSIRGTLLVQAFEVQVSDVGPITAANPGRYAALNTPEALMLFRSGEETPTRQIYAGLKTLPGDGDGIFPYSFEFTDLPLDNYRLVLAFKQDYGGYLTYWEGPLLGLTAAQPQLSGVSAVYQPYAPGGQGVLEGTLTLDGNPPMLGWVYLGASSAAGNSGGGAGLRAEFPNLNAPRLYYKFSGLSTGAHDFSILPASDIDYYAEPAALQFQLDGAPHARPEYSLSSGPVEPGTRLDVLASSIWYKESYLTGGGTHWPDPEDHTFAVKLLNFTPPAGSGDCFLEIASAEGDSARNARLWRYIPPEQYGLAANVISSRSLKSGRYNLRLVRLGATNAQREVLASYPQALRLSDPQPGWIEADGGESTQLLEWDVAGN